MYININWETNENTFMKRSTSASGNMPASFSLLASSVNRSIVTLFRKQNKFINKLIYIENKPGVSEREDSITISSSNPLASS